MKKILSMLFILLLSNVANAQGMFDTYCLGTLDCVTLTLDAYTSGRVEFEVKAPKESMLTTTCLYGPGQPRFEGTTGSTFRFSINTKLFRLDIGEQSGNVFLDVPVDKWYSYKEKKYETNWWNARYGQSPYDQCFYQICISVNVEPIY